MSVKQIALIGNPNVGKTTLFNQLTGLNQRVANWPGITLDRVSGTYKTGNETLEIIDFPGFYSLEYGEIEEQVVINDLKENEYDCIINIVDGTQLERNLILTSQLIKLGKPIVIAVNFHDLAKSRKIDIDILALERLYGIKVMAINPRNQSGITDLRSFLNQENFQSPNPMIKIKDETKGIIEQIHSEIIPAVINNQCAVDFETTTNKIDKIVLNRWLALPIMFLILYGLFALTFQYVGTPLQDMLDTLINEQFVPWISTAPILADNSMLMSLVVDGIVGGVGTVIVALPLILILFMGMTIIEDSGYMARISVILDRALRHIGLSGRAIIPLISGFGCTVPAVMATKGLQSDRERKMALMLLPFMSCTARVPIYSLFAIVFFPGYEIASVFALYLFGVFIAIIIGLLLKTFVYRETPSPFILELPEYHFPSFKSIFKHTLEKALGFLKKATTVILAGVILIWALSHYTKGLQYTEAMNESLLADLGNILAPVFAPLGFGTWQNVTGIISGFLAKETVVSTFGVVYNGPEGDVTSILNNFFTTRSAISFLVFTLLYTPCVAVVSTTLKEYGRKWAFIIALYPVAVAWIVSFIVYNLLGLFM